MLFKTSFSIYRLSFFLEYLIATARKRYLIKTLKNTLQEMRTQPTVPQTQLVESGDESTLWYSRASCHSLSLENATHLAGTGVQVFIYMGQMQPASSSVGGSVDARCDSHKISTCSRKLSIKAVLMEMVTRKWYI